MWDVNIFSNFLTCKILSIFLQRMVLNFDEAQNLSNFYFLDHSFGIVLYLRNISTEVHKYFLLCFLVEVLYF